MVQATPVPVAQALIDKLFLKAGGYPGTSRPVQPLYHRAISYNVDPTTFTYQGTTGPAHWPSLGYSACAGTAQSPINIPARASGHHHKTATQSPGYSLAAKPITDLITSVPSAVTVSQVHEAPKFTCTTPGNVDR